MALTVKLLGKANSPWGRVQTVTEWDYRSGISDILGRDSHNDIIAFEAKLRDWRRACYQAYRSTAFAPRAYVVLPELVATRVQCYRDVFERYGVGLCYCRSGELSILIEARPAEPLMKWLTDRAHTMFDGILNDRAGRPQLRSSDSLQPA